MMIESILFLNILFFIDQIKAARDGNLYKDSKTGAVLSVYCSGGGVDSLKYGKDGQEDASRTNKQLYCSFPGTDYPDIIGFLDQKNPSVNSITYRYFQDGKFKTKFFDRSEFDQNHSIAHFVPGPDRQDVIKEFLASKGITGISGNVTIAPDGIELLPTAKIWVPTGGLNYMQKKIDDYLVANAEEQDSSCTYAAPPQAYYHEDKKCKFCIGDVACLEKGMQLQLPVMCKLKGNRCPKSEDCIRDNDFEIKDE